jgi:purine-binding chemotaxis protein CheW
MAAPGAPDPTPAPASDLRLVCFMLAGQEFGVDIRAIKETIVMRPITRVFLTPDWVAGIINLRGDVVAVIDLARFLGLPRSVATAEARIIITRGRGKTAGLLIDRLSEVRTVDARAIREAPPGLPEAGLDILRGVVTLGAGERERPLGVLDLERMCDSERFRQFERKG